jgi:hypothetical protein
MSLERDKGIMENKPAVTVEKLIRTGALNRTARRQINMIASRFGLVVALGVAAALIVPRYFVAGYPVHWEDAIGWSLAAFAGGFWFKRATLLARFTRMAADLQDRSGIN